MCVCVSCQLTSLIQCNNFVQHSPVNTIGHFDLLFNLLCLAIRADLLANPFGLISDNLCYCKHGIVCGSTFVAVCLFQFGDRGSTWDATDVFTIKELILLLN